MGLKDLWDSKRLRVFQIIYQGYYVEFTVAQMPNQGTIPKTGSYRFRATFFGYFFGEAKK
jgi:hypothetical protein